jgi:hypothetical protein
VHETEKRAPAHGVYALARQLGGGLDEGLLCRYTRRGSEACCAWLVRGISVTQRRSLGEVMDRCWREQGGCGGMHAGGAGSGAAVAGARVMG